MFKKIIFILLALISLNSFSQNRNSELAHTLYAIIPNNADNNDVVVEMNSNHCWDTASAIIWSIIV